MCLFCISNESRAGVRWGGVRSVDARHWVQQRHVLSAVERQTLSAVMVHHLWDAGEHAAALVQGVAVFFGLSHDDVNAALTCPDTGESRRGRVQV